MASALSKLNTAAYLVLEQAAAAQEQRPWLKYAAAAAVGWPLLVRTLRYWRVRSLQRRFPYGTGPGQKPYSAMTEADAQAIITNLKDWDCPMVHVLGLQLALLRTYGIPSISRLLLATRQLGRGENVGRRYADTAAIVSEIYGNRPGSKRSAEAYGRLNYLHGVYIRAGRISNDDMLYVLALFMYDANDAIDALDWRRTTEVERCASGVFHYGMGLAMEIDLTPLLPLSSSASSSSSSPPPNPPVFRDGLHFYDALYSWSKVYERDNMVPDPANHSVAIHTLHLVQADYPRAAHGLVSGVVRALFNDRFLAACGWEAAGPVPRAVVAAGFAAKRFACRNLLPPRLKPQAAWRSYDPAEDVAPDGRRQLVNYAGMPYYVRPTLWNRWGPGAWYARLVGKALPGDEAMDPDGYLLKDAGPRQHSGKGWDEAEKTVELLMSKPRGGCPFA